MIPRPLPRSSGLRRHTSGFATARQTPIRRAMEQKALRYPHSYSVSSKIIREGGGSPTRRGGGSPTRRGGGSTTRREGVPTRRGGRGYTTRRGIWGASLTRASFFFFFFSFTPHSPTCGTGLFFGPPTILHPPPRVTWDFFSQMHAKFGHKRGLKKGP